MSEISTLISFTGRITRAELAKLPTPPATETPIPIPHAAVVETLVETLSHRQIAVVDEEFAVSKDDMEMFGVLDLATSFEGSAAHFLPGCHSHASDNTKLGTDQPITSRAGPFRRAEGGSSGGTLARFAH